MPQKIIKAKQEIFGSFQVIVSTEMQKFFLQTYGPNYDVNSLNSSLTFFMRNDLRPDFSYDKSKFVFNSTLKKNIRAFNQNARQETKFSEFIDEHDFNSVEEEDLYYSDNPFDGAFNAIYNSIEDRDVFSPRNKSLRQGAFSSLEETYEKAKTAALEKFGAYYLNVLKPNISSKYGVNIT